MFALIGVYMRQIVCLIIFALVSSSVIAIDCDYEMKILMDRSNYSSGELSFKIKALNIEGPAANSSSKLQIKGLQGNLVREYAPWKNEKITIQRTSGSYSPNLENILFLAALMLIAKIQMLQTILWLWILR